MSSLRPCSPAWPRPSSDPVCKVTFSRCLAHFVRQQLSTTTTSPPPPPLCQTRVSEVCQDFRAISSDDAGRRRGRTTTRKDNGQRLVTGNRALDGVSELSVRATASCVAQGRPRVSASPAQSPAVRSSVAAAHVAHPTMAGRPPARGAPPIKPAAPKGPPAVGAATPAGAAAATAPAAAPAVGAAGSGRAGRPPAVGGAGRGSAASGPKAAAGVSQVPAAAPAPAPPAASNAAAAPAPAPAPASAAAPAAPMPERLPSLKARSEPGALPGVAKVRWADQAQRRGAARLLTLFARVRCAFGASGGQVRARHPSAAEEGGRVRPGTASQRFAIMPAALTGPTAATWSSMLAVPRESAGAAATDAGVKRTEDGSAASPGGRDGHRPFRGRGGSDSNRGGRGRGRGQPVLQHGACTKSPPTMVYALPGR